MYTSSTYSYRARAQAHTHRARNPFPENRHTFISVHTDMPRPTTQTTDADSRKIANSIVGAAALVDLRHPRGCMYRPPGTGTLVPRVRYHHPYPHFYRYTEHIIQSVSSLSHIPPSLSIIHSYAHPYFYFSHTAQTYQLATFINARFKDEPLLANLLPVDGTSPDSFFEAWGDGRLLICLVDAACEGVVDLAFLRRRYTRRLGAHVLMLTM